MSLIQQTVASMDELIALTERKIELLKELKKALLIAEKAGVPADQIAKVGYDQSRDKRWQKWTQWILDSAAFVHQPNYVILKDGTKVEWEIDWEGPLKEYKEKQRERAKAYFDRVGRR